MSEGRQKDEWWRWSLFLSMFANANRDAKKRREPFTPDDFNPFAKRKQKKKLGKKESLDMLFSFCGVEPDEPIIVGGEKNAKRK